MARSRRAGGRARGSAATARCRATPSTSSPRRCDPVSPQHCSSVVHPCRRAGSSPRAASPARPARSCSVRSSRRGSSAAPGCRRSNGSGTSPSSPSPSSKASVTSCSPTPRRRCRSSPIPTSRTCSSPRTARSTTLALDGDDVVLALEHLADALGADADGAFRQPAARPERPTGALTAASVADAIGAVMPEGAIVADEAQTGGLFASAATAGAPRHDWLTLTGGAIGQGMPVATGAAIACPDRKVINLEADGSAMYTLQALWTQAREGLDVTTILFDNRSYAILNIELGRVGAERGRPASAVAARPLEPRPRLRRARAGHGCRRVSAGERRGAHHRPRAGARRARPAPHRRPAPGPAVAPPVLATEGDAMRRRLSQNGGGTLRACRGASITWN